MKMKCVFSPCFCMSFSYSHESCYDYVIVMFHFFAKLLQKINIFYIHISILCTYISNLSSNIIFAKEKF